MLGYIYLTDDEYIEDFGTKAEDIPGFFILQKEIKNASSGKDFFVNDEETGKPFYCSGIAWNDFLYYYQIWENYHYFGLPFGKGWVNERKWLLEFIKTFEKANEEIKFFLEKKMNNKGNMT